MREAFRELKHTIPASLKITTAFTISIMSSMIFGKIHDFGAKSLLIFWQALGLTLAFLLMNDSIMAQLSRKAERLNVNPLNSELKEGFYFLSLFSPCHFLFSSVLNLVNKDSPLLNKLLPDILTLVPMVGILGYHHLSLSQPRLSACIEN